MFITLMDLLGRGILFLFSNESIQDSDGSYKDWHIYHRARWFDKDSYSELLHHTGRKQRERDLPLLYINVAPCSTTNK